MTGFKDRQADMGGATVSDGDVSTSTEAMKVLDEQGADAWRAWVAAEQKRSA